MVTCTLSNSRFTIAFLRGSEVFDARPAPTGERAMKIALLLLALMEAVQSADQLVVMEDRDGRPRRTRRVRFSGRRQLIRGGGI